MQQYKYIKGSAADFVGAPDWASSRAMIRGVSAFVNSTDSRYIYIDGPQPGKEITGKFISFPWAVGHVELMAQREPIPEWNGNGLPPVGAKVEFYKSICYDYSNVGFLPETGDVVEVVAHKTTTDGNPVAVVFWDDKGAGRSNCFVGGSLAPIRTEAERKREDAVQEMIKAYFNLPPVETPNPEDYEAMGYVYDLISAGKIPGIKLD